MSDILIKGMEMPTRCADCKMYVEDIYCCHLLHRQIENPWADDGLEADCPLVPVPPHGRMIDADEFKSIKYELPDGQKAFNRGFHSGVQYVQRLIMDAPTIIQADHIGDGNEMVKPRKRDEAIQRLKDIGVLNEAGKVVEPYDKIFVPAEEGKT